MTDRFCWRMTWGLGSNVLPIILLSVKFMIVLLSEKNEKRIYDYSVVESPQNFSAKTFKSSVWKKWSHTSPLSTHPGKYIMVVYHLQKDYGKFCWKVNGRRLFGSSFQRKISGSNGTSENSDGIFQTEIRVPFLQTIDLWFQFQAFAIVFR